MQWYSVLAIYFLFWFLALFLVLPFGMRTAEEAGVEREPGHADSAPHEFRPGRIAIRTTIVAAAMMAAYWVAYAHGYLNVGPPASS